MKPYKNVVTGPWEKSENEHFLLSGNPSPKYGKSTSETIPTEYESHISEEQYLSDCEKMTPTQLREHYKLTYSSWRNTKARCKTHGFVLHQNFELFSSFLRILGPRRFEKYTLDRLNTNDKEYAPGKVDWRDKTTQNNNKTNNVYLTYKGETRTIAIWAKILNIKPNTLYKRKSNGWSDAAVITGKKDSAYSWEFLHLEGLRTDILDIHYAKHEKCMGELKLSQADYLIERGKLILDTLRERQLEDCSATAIDALRAVRWSLIISQASHFKQKISEE